MSHKHSTTTRKNSRNSAHRANGPERPKLIESTSSPHKMRRGTRICHASINTAAPRLAVALPAFALAQPAFVSRSSYIAISHRQRTLTADSSHDDADTLMS